MTGDELAEFERHLEQCASCAEEVRGLRETTARLGLATAIAPPPWMRDQVLATTSRTRQLPPPGRKVIPINGSRRMTRMRHLASRPVALGAMSALAAAVIVLAVFQVSARDQLHQAQSSASAVAAVLSAPDAHIEMTHATVGGTVTAVISRKDSAAVITTSGMPRAGSSKVYQLWVITAAGARSAGLMPGGTTGATSPVLADDIKSGDSLAITIEPAGGSSQPTSTAVVLLRSAM